MAAHLIPDTEVKRYSRPPSPATVGAVSDFQNNIRDALGSDFETFLQGSYKNDTSVRDLNDVDVVALRKHTVSSVFSAEHYSNVISWDDIFGAVSRALENSARFNGKTSRGDKCIVVNSTWKADVVPAVRITAYDQDPIAIYSFKEAKERQNFPRLHYDNGVKKHQETNSVFKPVVRMFKRWAANHWPEEDVAPSFYVECLIYNVPSERFADDLAVSFFSVGYYIETTFSHLSVIRSVAEDKDILTANEWDPLKFERFQAQLVRSTELVASAFKAGTQASATQYWRAAFNE